MGALLVLPLITMVWQCVGVHVLCLGCHGLVAVGLDVVGNGRLLWGEHMLCTIVLPTQQEASCAGDSEMGNHTYTYTLHCGVYVLMYLVILAYVA